MNAQYVKWTNVLNPAFGVVLGEISGFGKLRPLWRGEPMGEGFPSDVTIDMDPDFPDNTVLTDNLYSSHHLIIASTRLAEFLRSVENSNLEALPVRIRDHKGKIAAEYLIVHPRTVKDCLDTDASKAVFVPGSTTVLGVARIVLKEQAVDPKDPIIRIARFPPGLLVRDDVAQEVRRREFTGVTFEEIEMTP
jgi:hypothetical protein